MKAYALFRLGPRVESGINIFHFKMFHGLGRRQLDDAGMPLWTMDDPVATRSPLLVVHNVVRMPEVFMPMFGFVVSEKVKRAMERIYPSDSIPVRFVKLFRLDWQEGREPRGIPAWRWDYDATFERVKATKGNPDDLVGTYYELIPYWHEVEGEGSDFCEARLRFEEGEKKLRLSPALVARGKLTYTSSACHILDRSLFEALAPFMDWRYFGNQELRI